MAQTPTSRWSGVAVGATLLAAMLLALAIGLLTAQRPPMPPRPRLGIMPGAKQDQRLQTRPLRSAVLPGQAIV